MHAAHVNAVSSLLPRACCCHDLSRSVMCRDICHRERGVLSALSLSALSLGSLPPLSHLSLTSHPPHAAHRADRGVLPQRHGPYNLRRERARRAPRGGALRGAGYRRRRPGDAPDLRPSDRVHGGRRGGHGCAAPVVIPRMRFASTYEKSSNSREATPHRPAGVLQAE